MEKINDLKKLLNDFNLDGYIVPKNDEFFNEYISPDKDRLKYITNFSGSFGLAVLEKKKNYLFVDGRYTFQAKKQSGKLFNIITIPKKLPLDIFKNKKLKIGFDPKLHTQKTLDFFFKRNNCKLIPIRENLIDKIWTKKNNEKASKFYVLPNEAVGKSYLFKLNKVINILKKRRVDIQFISSNENIAWLLNIRGRDSEFTPIPNAYAILSKNKKVIFFCNLKKINKSFKNKFKNIEFVDIKLIYFFLKAIKNKKVLIDSSSCSIYFENILKKENSLISHPDPIYFLKSIKSKIEIKNTIKSHVYDGAALTKFLFWLKKNYLKKNISEISAQEKLLMYRKKNKKFKFLSFPTISGSGPNGAIIHYKATKSSNRKLKKGDIYLVDSGGQYNFGTTDVTRTISLNNNNKKIREIFTRVLKGHIAVATYKLKKNTFGNQIDNAARKSLRSINLDYAHGTGHGVGYFLNVHEGPPAISKNNKINFKEGMIVSNEPGYYKNGKFGIRIENLIRVKKNKKEFIFENLTMVPIDKTLIDKKILKKNEINWVNNYHHSVLKNLKNLMNKVEFSELKNACSKI